MNIGILGTGSFALSIAFLLEKNDHSFCIIGRDVQQLKQLEKEQRNTKYSVYQFKNKIKTMQISPDFNFSSFDLIFYCLPSSSLFLVENTKTPIVFTNKGFENYFLFEKFSNYCILSGGSYAVEILQGVPCYVTLASSTPFLQKKVQQLLQSPYCILSLTQKTKEVEIFGIYKNIIAVSCGIVEELQLGKNISSAFLTRCLEFIISFYNLDKYSLLEPAGIGDLFLSCGSSKSRNFSYGCSIVRDSKFKSSKLVEGLNSLLKLKEQKPNSLLSKIHSILLLLQEKNHEEAKERIHFIVRHGFILS